MSFIVSNGFNLHGTIKGVTLLELFQSLKPIDVKPPLNQQPISSCFTVSVVSLLIHLENETEKVSSLAKRLRAFLLIGQQDYTWQLAASSKQGVHHA